MFNPFLPSFLEDPYPAYERLRVEDPVHRSMALQAWVLTRYDECVAVLRDHQTFSSESGHATGQLAEELTRQRLQSPLGHVPTVLNSDPPVHTRLRAIVSRAFTPRVVEEMRPRVEEIAESLFADRGEDGPFDVMSGLAQPLPVIVIAELLGVPPSDRALFKRWSNAIAAATAIFNSPELLADARGAAQELIDYLGRFVEERRQRPRQDLISMLVRAEQSEEALSSEELLAFCVLLLVAGNETTTNLIGNGVLALLGAERSWALLRGHPEMLPGAVEEMARLDSPVQGLVRFARADAKVGGATIAQGDTVMVMVGAANHDPTHFPQPRRLDVGRDPTRHLAFGLGVHSCIGAPLARMEAEVAFAGLLRRVEQPRATGDGVARGGTFMLRGLAKLEIEP